MDPAMLAVARRFSLGARRDLRGRMPGWEALDVATPPNLGLGPVDADAARRINAFIPISGPPLAPAAPFYLGAVGAERERALLCLTQAIYYEAALEPEDGQAAVAQTVLNRVRHPAFPPSICGVVYQGAQEPPGCQFTFTCDGSRDRRPVAAPWRRAWGIAERAVNGYVMATIGSATSYHADYVFPRWSPTLIKVGQIGAHIFYRFPGPTGLPAALRRPYRGEELAVSMDGPPPTVSLAMNDALPQGQYFYVEPRTTAPIRVRPAPGDVIGGRRVPTPDEIARINAALLEMEKPSPPSPSGEGQTP